MQKCLFITTLLFVSLLICLMAGFVFFINPSNWKNFVDMAWFDWVLLILSNVTIVGTALFLIWRTFLIWRKLFVKR